jgi:RND family efflux transporter MFP subunit
MDDLEHGKRDTAKWVRRILPIVILALGIGGTVALVKSRKKPKRKHEIKKSMLVEVLKTRQEQRKVQVTSNGTIQPRQEVALAPEVSGKVRWINQSLVVGGFMKSGERMLVIEPADYKLFVDKARSAVALAAKNLALAQSSARVARSEWKLHGNGAAARGTPNPLTLYEPQLKAAQAAMASAQADLSQAKLNLRRTVVTAPFNLRVRKKRVDKGQYVRVGQELATVYGTDVAEVIVPLPVSELHWLKIPRRVKGSNLKGPPVTVRLKVGEAVHERQGVLVRSVGEVDPTGRMSKVVAAIEDPYNLRGTRPDGVRPMDFEIGAFVEVALQGRSLARVIPIPVEALHAGAVVWVIDGKGALRIRKVTTARVTETEALILSGIEPGERVILSHVAGAVDGMALRVAGEAAAKGSKGKGSKGKGKGKGKGSVNATGAKSKPWARRGESQVEGGPRR